MTTVGSAAPDPEADVFVASFDVRLKNLHARSLRRPFSGYRWNVFLGGELIDHFDLRADAITLARCVALKSGRPAWISDDGHSFVPLQSARGKSPQ